MSEKSPNTILLKPRAPLQLDPARWNTAPVVTQAHCLSFAVDHEALGRWEPGYLSVISNHNMARAQHIQAVRREWHHENPGAHPNEIQAFLLEDVDGFEHIRAHDADPMKDHVFAYHPIIMHAWRLEGDGYWADKPGEQPARKNDLRGDLNDKNFLPVMLSGVPVSYYRIPKNGVIAAPRNQVI